MDLQLIKITYKGNEHGVPPPPLFLLKELKKEINSGEEAFGTIRYPPSNQTDLDFHDFGKLLFCLSRFDFYNESAPPLTFKNDATSLRLVNIVTPYYELP